METVEIGENIKEVAQGAETVASWYVGYKIIVSIIGIIIVLIILLIFVAAIYSGTKSETLTNVKEYDYDTQEAKEWLCHFDLLQKMKPGHILTPEEIRICQRKASKMSDDEADRLFCEYRTYKRRMECTNNPNYKVTPKERIACASVYGPHGQRFN